MAILKQCAILVPTLVVAVDVKASLVPIASEPFRLTSRTLTGIFIAPHHRSVVGADRPQIDLSGGSIVNIAEDPKFRSIMAEVANPVVGWRIKA